MVCILFCVIDKFPKGRGENQLLNTIITANIYWVFLCTRHWANLFFPGFISGSHHGSSMQSAHGTNEEVWHKAIIWLTPDPSGYKWQSQT